MYKIFWDDGFRGNLKQKISQSESVSTTTILTFKLYFLHHDSESSFRPRERESFWSEFGNVIEVGIFSPSNVAFLSQLSMDRFGKIFGGLMT